MATSNTFGTSNTYVKYNITVNINSQSITNNTSNITVTVRFWRSNSGYETYGSGTVYCGINGTSYSQAVAPSQRITSSGIDLFSRTVDIPHNNDGTKTIWCSAYISLNTPLSSSDQGFNVTLPTIPRAATFSNADNFNDTDNPKIYFNNPAGFKLQLKMEAGGNTSLIVRDNLYPSSPYTFSLTEAERNILRALTPNSNSLTVRFTVGTYMPGSSSASNHSYGDRTMTITNANPTFTASQLTYQDTNSVVTAITGNNQLIVRNKSTLSCTFTAATPQKSATMSKYQTIFNGVTTDRLSAGTYSLGAVNSAQNLTLQVKAIDSRGNNTTISKTVTILDWVPPIINASAARVNNFENQTNLLANVQISDVGGFNLLQTLQYRVKKNSDTAWGSWTNFKNYITTQINLNNLYAWDLQVQATDKFGSSTQDLLVPKGMPIAFFDTQKLSVGINLFPTNQSSLETVNFIATGNSKISGKDVIFSSGTWTPSAISDATAPTHTIAYRYGRYYRINSLVFITFHMKINITNKGTGYARISGLPFVATSGINNQGLGLRELTINTAAVGNPCGYVIDSSSQIVLSSSSGMVAQQWNTGDCWVGFSGFYLINNS